MGIKSTRLAYKFPQMKQAAETKIASEVYPPGKKAAGVAAGAEEGKKALQEAIVPGVDRVPTFSRKLNFQKLLDRGLVVKAAIPRPIERPHKNETGDIIRVVSEESLVKSCGKLFIRPTHYPYSTVAYQVEKPAVPPLVQRKVLHV